MNFHCIPYQLQFKFPFRIAHGMRTHTPVVYVRLQHNGLTAFGEAALPPYLPETQATVIAFVNDFANYVGSLGVEECMQALQTFGQANMAARAAIDMALWNLKAQQEGKSIAQLLGIADAPKPLNTYTIGVCSLDEMKLKVDDALQNGFQLFKLKVDAESDIDMQDNFRQISSLPYCVDGNQCWNNFYMTTVKIEWLYEEGCLFIEQPMPVSMDKEMIQLKEVALLPLFADESCQTIHDLERLRDGFHGINIKLMKCGGITPAFEMLKAAKQMGYKILIGCMSESSVGCNAAAQLSALADYTDLDGPYLIDNDAFGGVKMKDGSLVATTLTQVKPL
jgi:L-alanine-DL-glutamate epimerase-like enolase superfamily enzyme